MKNWLFAVSWLAMVSVVVLHGQTAAPRPPGESQALATSPQRALLNQYCVTCHNERLKTANLTLDTLDVARVGDNAAVWEKVVRKLRAGMMPPAGSRRADRVAYQSLITWLETELDRRAEEYFPPPGLHRLNRTEYANVIRDLLALEIDPAMFLPPDDSSRGFDNIAGSLTISPTLIETYATAATKIARMAVGFWRTPTESLYIKKTDSSQVHRLPEMPFGTRGGMTVKHVFPADGEYTFTVRNLGVGTYIPGEQLELSIDGERVHQWLYTNMGLSSGMDSEADGELTATIPVTAGSRMVGLTFVATNYRPSLDVAQHFARKSLENGRVNELSNYPVIGALNIQGPFNASRPAQSASRDKVFQAPPGMSPGGIGVPASFGPRRSRSVPATPSTATISPAGPRVTGSLTESPGSSLCCCTGKRHPWTSDLLTSSGGEPSGSTQPIASESSTSSSGSISQRRKNHHQTGRASRRWYSSRFAISSCEASPVARSSRFSPARSAIASAASSLGSRGSGGGFHGMETLYRFSASAFRSRSQSRRRTVEMQSSSL